MQEMWSDKLIYIGVQLYKLLPTTNNYKHHHYLHASYCIKPKTFLLLLEVFGLFSSEK